MNSPSVLSAVSEFYIKRLYGLSNLFQEICKIDRVQLRPVVSLAPTFGIALILSVSLWFNNPIEGVLMTGGALWTGFSSFRQIQGSHLLALTTATGLTMISATLGTLAGNWVFTAILSAFIWGFLYGVIQIFTEDVSAIFLQAVVAQVITLAFPSEGFHAFYRSGLILIAGLTQLIFLILFRLIWDRHFLSHDLAQIHLRNLLKAVQLESYYVCHGHMQFKSWVGRHGLRLGTTLALAVAIYESNRGPNGYWLPLTTLLILKADFHRTYTSGLGRVLGTLLAFILGSFLTWLLHPSPWFLVLIVTLFGWTAFTLQKVNYALFSLAITSFIVFLISLTGIPEGQTLINRLVLTVLGCLLALISRAIAPSWDAIPGGPIFSVPLEDESVSTSARSIHAPTG